MSKPLRILHICNDFSGSLVHKNLYSNLDEKGVVQIIYVPLRTESQKAKNTFNFDTDCSTIVYSTLISTYNRIFFNSKIKKLVEDVQNKVNVEEIDVIHATTLFSDGAVALELFKCYKKPFIVAVRNTDINYFLKYRPYLKVLLHEILMCASKVVFISESLKNTFQNHWLVRSKWANYDWKTIIVCNGVDDYWLRNRSKKKVNENPNALFIGRFDENKNVLRLINALEKTRHKFPRLTLTLVGGGGNQHVRVLKKIQRKSWIHFAGPIYGKSELKSIFDTHSMFVMTSHRETFGLVYIEALTQGLPVLYSKGQGIDGVFTERIGESANSRSVKDIYEAMTRLMTNFNNYNLDELEFSRFNWLSISETYKVLYNDAIQEVNVVKTSDIC